MSTQEVLNVPFMTEWQGDSDLMELELNFFWQALIEQVERQCSDLGHAYPFECNFKFIVPIIVTALPNVVAGGIEVDLAQCHDCKPGGYTAVIVFSEMDVPQSEWTGLKLHCKSPERLWGLAGHQFSFYVQEAISNLEEME